MPLFLKHRQQHLVELMDNPDSDVELLERTYHHFRTINRLLSKWKSIYRKEIRPVLKQQNGSATLLDIGFGGGDIPALLSSLANSDGFRLKITAIETDKRSLNYVKKKKNLEHIMYRHASSSELLEESTRFDFVISNHLLHHLDESEFLKLCSESSQLASQKVIFNDIERSDIGYLSFFILSQLFFRNSFVWYDGLVSIKRSFTFAELKNAAPAGWQVSRLFPFRLILSYNHSN